jgi:hypothetical protein
VTGPSNVRLRLRAIGWLSLSAIAFLLSQLCCLSLRAADVAAPTAAPATAAPAAKAAPATDKPADAEKKPEGDSKADKKPEEGKPAEGQPAAEDKDKDKSKENLDQPVRRPTEPPKPADVAELKARPDESGMVTFSFRGQPWQAVLEWLADISHMSLDWQEAPAGYLDLTTRRKYTVDEARDLINSILLSKGYTLLRNGEILLVANLKTLDTSLVPRVTLKELDKRGSYELVRVFFPLERLQAEPMAEEIKPLLSVPYGKINAMKTTNRLDIMDTAGNLRRIRDVVGAEQGESGKNHQLREFKLHNARADDVMTTLKQLLGIQDKSSGPMSRDEMQQEMQRQQQMMQQMQQQQQGEKKNAAGPKDQEPKTYLAINRRENSIMALATPDKLAVIEQAVSLIDVPSDNNTSFANVNRVRIYRLIGAEPGPIVNVLKDMGNLDPSTRLETDIPNKAIIVSGPLVDHATVQAVIDKLDGSTRRFEVIQLRKLGADYVAGSIEFLMRGPSKDASRPRVLYDFGGGGSNRNTDPNKDGGFQVEADTKNNRLLLRANDVELQEIRALMIKLGEDPMQSGRGDTMRVIHSTPGKETDLLLERLKRVWPSISNSPLQLDTTPVPDGDAEHSSTSPPEKKSVVPAKGDKIEDTRRTEKSAEDDSNLQVIPSATADARAHDGRHLKHHSGEVLVAVKESNAAAEDAADSLAANDAATNDAITNTPPGKSADVQNDVLPPAGNRGDNTAPPPVSIIRGRQGLIVSSPDPAMVEQLTKLIDQLSPNDTRFQVFTLKHTYARDVCTLLEKIFEEGDGKEKTRGFNPFWFDFDQPSDDKKDRNRLSKREPLKFTPDSVTNSILVQNADEEQLVRIRELVEFYDRAEPPDSQSIRKTQIVAVKHAKAQAVADVLKDVYRDLLSPNDKALVSNNPRQEQPRPAYTYFNMGDNKSATDNVPKFKGLLSIGIDATSNSLVVSAPQFLLADVLSMIERLDAATLPKEPVVRVINVGGMLDDPYIKDAIKSVADPSAAKSSSSSSRRDRQNGQGNGQNGNNNNGRNGNGQNNNRNGNNGNGGGNNNR